MDRLPEELLVYVLSLTSPIDACRMAAVSRAFRAAADSDAVWSCFLPRNLPRFANGELPHTPTCKKDLFRRLSGQPALLPHKMMGMQLDRATGAERLIVSAKALQISQYPPPNSTNFSWARAGSVSIYSERDKRFIFSETAVFHYVEKLGIRAKIQRNVLSENTTYAAYMVFKLAPLCYEQSAIQEAMASIGVTGSKSTCFRQIFLQGYIEDGDGAGNNLPRKHILPGLSIRAHAIPSVGENVHFPRKRADGWMEVELGEFHNGEGDGGGVVSIRFVEKSEGRKNGFFLWAIELRSEKH